MAGRAVDIRIEGLRELRASLRRVEPESARELAVEGRGVVDHVRDMAVHEAADRGYNDTGDLIAGLRGRFTGTTGSIRDTAKHGDPPFPYPARLEWQNQGAGAFIRPAIAAAKGYITAQFEQAVGRVIRKFNRGAL